jgi:hypothetical protein
MIIYLHQRYTNRLPDPALSPYYGRVAPYHSRVPSTEIRHVYVDETMSIARVIAAVANRSQGDGSIWQLMVNCHGNPGAIDLGTGLNTANARYFRGLRRFMHHRGKGILIGCCYAAAGKEVFGTAKGCIREQSYPGNGLSLLIEIARHADVPVMGALDQQLTWELNGPVLTVQPNGTYTVTTGREVASIRGGQSGGTYTCD